VPGIAVGFGTPYQEQIDFLRNKLRLPTQRWDDIMRSAHDRCFIVAGAAKADLLADLQDAVVRAAQGGGLDQFRKDFKAIVARRGWSGWTGEGTPAGEAWRTRVIYQTNLTTSYWASRYQEMTDPQYVRWHPFWRYVHSDAVAHPRKLHLAWDGLTLPHDHAFWQTHFAPNGWGCMCRIVPVTRAEGERAAKAGKNVPPSGWDQIDPKTGVQVGIDKGFDYAPGASVARNFQSLIDDKLIRLDAPIGAAMWEELKPVLMAERLAAWQTQVDTILQTMQAGGNTLQVHTVEPATVQALQDEGVVLENAAVWMRDTELLHALRETKVERGAALPEDVWRNLPTLLQDATPYLDTVDHALIYTMDLGEKVGKVVVRVNYNAKGRFEGVRARLVSNFVQTGGIVKWHNIETEPYLINLKK